MRLPPNQIEALLLLFAVCYVALSLCSYGHRTGGVKWRVLEHAVSTENRVRFLAIMRLPPSGTARSPGYTFRQTLFINVLHGL